MTNFATSIMRRVPAPLHRTLPWCVLAVALLPGAYAAVAQVKPAPPDGSVAGQVIYTGELPDPDPIKVERDRSFCGDTVPDESVMVSRETRGLAAAVISLEGVSQESPAVAPQQKLLLENHTCRFVPRVSAVLGETILIISNRDPVMHNTHIRKKTRFGDNFVNVVQPHQARVEKALPQTGYLDVRCDAHPFMHASIHVFAHPYFAVTDSAGHFEVRHVPPGTYTLRLWHEALGKQERLITVPERGTVSVNLELGPRH